MAEARRVELLDHDPSWSRTAASEIAAMSAALGAKLAMAEHIGSTAIAGIGAKPVIDLVAGVVRIEDFDPPCPALPSLGYVGLGENGLPGRRFFTRSDRNSGQRLVHLHVFEAGSPEIVRHLAFRDYLRAHKAAASAYEREKARCQGIHADDPAAYTECKAGWIRSTEADALAWFQQRNQAVISTSSASVGKCS